MENQKPKKSLSLPTIAVSIFCVLAIIFGKDLAYGAISITINLLDIQLSLVNIVWILTNMTTFGLIVSISSAAVLSYYLLRSRLRVDLPKTRKQAILFGTTLAIGLFIVSSLFVPSSLAGNFTATASYHLDTPLPIAKAYCGEYDNSSYFGLNGANWQNVIVDTNKTLVEETILNSVTSGNIWSEISFDYANLACPANVSFTENVNGVQRVFGNIANSQGSPYTVSAGANADDGQYFAEDRKGTICFTSTNQTSVLANITNSASVGSTVYATSGIFGNQESHLIIGNATESLTTAQVVYQDSPNHFSLASASANSTVGYGYIWLVVQDTSTNEKCLLMSSGIFTSSWNWAVGPVWVSETSGSLQQPYPSTSGDQLVSPATAINSTTIIFNNPLGFYMEIA